MSIQFISGFVISIRDTLNYYTSIYHTLNFIFSFIHQSSEKESQFSSSPVFVFLFHPRMSHIFFLIFRKPRALSTDETRPWKRDRTRNKGVPRKNCDFQAERRRLVSPRKRTVLFRNRRFQPPLSPEFLNPMPAIMVGAKNADTVLSSAKKRAGNVNFIYSIQFPRARPSKGWPTFISTFFFLSLLSRGRKDWWKKLVKKFWKWINIEFLIAILSMRRRESEMATIFFNQFIIYFRGYCSIDKQLFNISYVYFLIVG